MTGPVLLLVTLALASAGGVLWRHRTGRLRVTDGTADVWQRLGVQPGARASLVQFSSAFCRPCVATRRVLSDVAQMVDGVQHVEVDAEQHLDAVRALKILKTPTVLVLDADLREVRRASGQPRRADVIAALGEVLV